MDHCHFRMANQPHPSTTRTLQNRDRTKSQLEGLDATMNLHLEVLDKTLPELDGFQPMKILGFLSSWMEAFVAIINLEAFITPTLTYLLSYNISDCHMSYMSPKVTPAYALAPMW